MEYIRTKRGARSLVYRGHRSYVVNRRGHDGTLDDRIVSQRDDHDHAPDEGEITADKIVPDMKLKAMESPRPIPAIYHDAIQQIAMMGNKGELAAKMPTFDQCKSSLYDSRRKRLPPLPEKLKQ